MPPKKTPSTQLAPVVATVIRPVATRLNRIEDLLIEMRGALDFQLKRITALQRQIDILIEENRVRLPDDRVVGSSESSRSASGHRRDNSDAVPPSE
jgi:hypothetical protein